MGNRKVRLFALTAVAVFFPPADSLSPGRLEGAEPAAKDSKTPDEIAELHKARLALAQKA